MTSAPTGNESNLLGSSIWMSEGEQEDGRVSPNEASTIRRRRRARTQAVEEKERATTKSMLADRMRAEKEEGLRKARYVYRDYSRIRPSPESIFVQRHQMQQRDATSIRTQKLPAKLSAMLSTSDYQHIISWMPHGRAWKVQSFPMFVEHVIPHFFEYNNYNSFIRLINAWGFRRMTKGPDRNAYWHELFLRDLPHLHSKMHRLTPNEKKIPLDPEDEPDLYRITDLFPPAATTNDAFSSLLTAGGVVVPVHDGVANVSSSNVHMQSSSNNADACAANTTNQMLVQQSNAAAVNLFQANMLRAQQPQGGGGDQHQPVGLQELLRSVGAHQQHDHHQHQPIQHQQQQVHQQLQHHQQGLLMTMGGGGGESQPHQTATANLQRQQAMMLREQSFQLEQLRKLEQLRQQQ